VSLPLDFHPHVRVDTNQAYSWYEARRAGLGTAFLDAVEAALARVRDNPEGYGVVEGDVRGYPVRRYPYVVYYRNRPDRVEVLAVYHTARDPAGWQSRV
jgi:plasmid stabilization system protein ParE